MTLREGKETQEMKAVISSGVTSWDVPLATEGIEATLRDEAVKIQEHWHSKYKRGPMRLMGWEVEQDTNDFGYLCDEEAAIYEFEVGPNYSGVWKRPESICGRGSEMGVGVYENGEGQIILEFCEMTGMRKITNTHDLLWSHDGYPARTVTYTPLEELDRELRKEVGGWIKEVKRNNLVKAHKRSVISLVREYAPKETPVGRKYIAKYITEVITTALEEYENNNTLVEECIIEAAEYKLYN